MSSTHRNRILREFMASDPGKLDISSTTYFQSGNIDAIAMAMPAAYTSHIAERIRWGCADRNGYWAYRPPTIYERVPLPKDERDAGNMLAKTTLFVTGDLSPEKALAFVPASVVREAQSGNPALIAEVDDIERKIRAACNSARARLVNRLLAWVL
jgi:hypothetical protein